MTADNKIDSFHTTHHSDPPITFGIRVLYPLNKIVVSLIALGGLATRQG